MHKVASMIEASVGIPLLHIADSTALKIREAGYSKVGLLGTRFTMEQDFYVDRLQERHGLQVLVPKTEDRELVHRVIYEELCLGKVLPGSRAEYRRVIADLKGQGAQAIILGCTEISLLVGPDDAEIPLFDTARIHARSAAEWALAPE
jgi:aspartate racemase